MRNGTTDSLSEMYTRLFLEAGCSAREFPDAVPGSFNVHIVGDDYVSFDLYHPRGVLQVYHWSNRPREWFVKF